MLEHVGRQHLATRMRKAIDRTLNEDKVRTRDLGGTASTEQFAEAVIGRIG
jgi:isocitrate dehydrogenase (NAD+)